MERKYVVLKLLLADQAIALDAVGSFETTPLCLIIAASCGNLGEPTYDPFGQTSRL